CVSAGSADPALPLAPPSPTIPPAAPVALIPPWGVLGSGRSGSAPQPTSVSASTARTPGATARRDPVRRRRRRVASPITSSQAQPKLELVRKIPRLLAAAAAVTRHA